MIIFDKPVSIAVIGPHYSGKSTLCSVFEEKLKFTSLKEDWEKDPYREKRGDSKDYLRSQYWFLKHHINMANQSEKLKKHGQNVVMDTFAYSTLIFSKTKLNVVDYDVFETIFKAVSESLVMPDVVIYLYANVNFLYDVNRLKRVSKKNGPTSDLSVKKDWLKKVVMINDSFFSNWNKTPLIKVDVSKNDFKNERVFFEILQNIKQTL